MGYRIEPDKVREIAMSLMRTIDPWDYGKPDDVGYLKTAMYNKGIIDLADEIVIAMESLKKA